MKIPFNNLRDENLNLEAAFLLTLFLLFSAASALADPIALDNRGDLYSVSAVEYFFDFLPALVLEAIAITLLVRKELRTRIPFLFLWIVITNVTWFGLNTVLTLVKFPSAAEICSGELAVVAVETVMLRAVLRSPRFVVECARVASWGKCLGFSVIGNLVSLLAGYALHWMLPA